MGKRNMEQEPNNNIKPLDNAFVRSNPNTKRAKQKAALFRRLAVFLIIAVVFIVGLTQFSSMLFCKKNKKS